MKRKDLRKGFVWDEGSLWGDLRKPNLPPTEPFALHSQKEVQGSDLCFCLLELGFRFWLSFTSKTYMCKKIPLWKRKHIKINEMSLQRSLTCATVTQGVHNMTFTHNRYTTGLLSIHLLLPTVIGVATLTHTALVNLEGENPADTSRRSSEPGKHW